MFEGVFMAKNSDETYQRFKDWDMSKGVRGVDNPMMKKFLQAKIEHETKQLNQVKIHN